MRSVVLYLVGSLFFSKVCGLNEVLKRTQPLYGLSTLVEEIENRTLCQDQLNMLRISVEEEKVWAIRVLDASGRPQQGFTYGNNFWIGSHSQCKDISNTRPLEVNNAKIKPFKTPYDYPPYPMDFVMVNLKHNSNLQRHVQLPLEWIIQLGMCMPRSCTEEDIFNISDNYLKKRYLEFLDLYNTSLKITGVRKITDDTGWIFKTPKIIALGVILTILITLTIAGTLYEIRRSRLKNNVFNGNNASSNGKSGCQKSFPEMQSFVAAELVSDTSSLLEGNTLGEILQCFSFFSNTKNLMKTKLSADSIGCIHGLRFISMLWVVAVHSVFFQSDFMSNPPIGYRLSEDFMSQIFSNGTYCVDSYLFLSGFLVTYLYYKSKYYQNHIEKPTNYWSKLIGYVTMCINRFCRLTPVYMVVLLFTNVLYTIHRKRSTLMFSEEVDIVCDQYWWRNILYINNLFPRKEMCMSWSWYLSVDMQFFVVTTFLLILSTIVFKVSATAVILLILITIVSTTWKSYDVGYIPTMDEQFIQLDAIYDLPWNRMGPYLVGVITAYILVLKLQNKLPLTKKMRIFLWTMFPLLNLWILFTLYTRQLSVEFSAVYMGISRTLWGVGLAWVLIACCTGNATLLNKLLSFKGFIPLSRITYCAYLLNPVMTSIIYLGSESATQISTSEVTLATGAVALLSFLAGYILSVMVESPFILLTKMAFRKIGKKKELTS